MIDPIYITRAEIVALAGVSKSQVYKVTADQTLFPEPAGTISWRKKTVWYRLDVMEFLKYHEWKHIENRNYSRRKDVKQSASKAIPEPSKNKVEEPSYITITEIIRLSRSSRSQVYNVTKDPASGFPNTIGTLERRGKGRKAFIWDREQVMSFLETHEWKTTADKRPFKPGKIIFNYGTKANNATYETYRN